MSPQRLAVFAVLCGTLVLNGWVAAGLAGFGSPDGEARIAVPTPRTSAIAKDSADAVSATGIIDAALPDPRAVPSAVQPAPIASADTADQKPSDVAASAPAVEAARIGILDAALPGPRAVLPPATPPVPLASADTADQKPNDVAASAPAVEAAGIESDGAALPEPREPLPATPPARLVSLFRSAPLEEELKPAVRPVETPNECLVAEICIDDYLWSFYQQTPKVDTNKVTERIKAAVKRKGKLRTIVKTMIKYVVADFAWKDPIAAQKAGMSVKDYVIGGMDRGFKQKLYYALRAMDDAGMMPGITSAFRDDYRQSIASGNKAASDSSYHGGSRRGGYGHGLAADLVSLKGETRLERYAASKELWKWIDAREKELGIGRPYLDRDPPHVGPIDGPEYAAKRGGAKAKLAQSIMKRRQAAAAGGNPRVTKLATKAGS